MAFVARTKEKFSASLPSRPGIDTPAFALREAISFSTRAICLATASLAFSWSILFSATAV